MPMNPDQVRVVFERVAYHMVLAGWLKSYAFTAGIGHELVWQADGAQKALLLKDLSDQFHLADCDESPAHFHMACMGRDTRSGVFVPELRTQVSAFWLRCVNELDLDGDGDGQLALVHLVTHWGPEAETSSAVALCC